LTWLWREYDPGRAKADGMEKSERAKPVFRAKIANRDAW